MIKLLAGSYSVHVNQKSHGGYTPLHLACQFGHQEVFDILVKAYGADPHLRDNSGRKPSKCIFHHIIHNVKVIYFLPNCFFVHYIDFLYLP